MVIWRRENIHQHVNGTAPNSEHSHNNNEYKLRLLSDPPLLVACQERSAYSGEGGLWFRPNVKFGLCIMSSISCKARFIIRASHFTRTTGYVHQWTNCLHASLFQRNKLLCGNKDFMQRKHARNVDNQISRIFRHKKTSFRWFIVVSKEWCGRRDSNSHTLRRQNLNLVRLPISPLPRCIL